MDEGLKEVLIAVLGGGGLAAVLAALAGVRQAKRTGRNDDREPADMLRPMTAIYADQASFRSVAEAIDRNTAAMNRNSDVQTRVADIMQQLMLELRERRG